MLKFYKVVAKIVRLYLPINHVHVGKLQVTCLLLQSLPMSLYIVFTQNLQLKNKYQVLQSLVEADQHGYHSDSQLEGNKNETGRKLGQKPCYNTASSVTVSTALKGNKNKTGNKLGQVTQGAVNNSTIETTVCTTLLISGATKTDLGRNRVRRSFQPVWYWKSTPNRWATY